MFQVLLILVESRMCQAESRMGLLTSIFLAACLLPGHYLNPNCHRAALTWPRVSSSLHAQFTAVAKCFTSVFIKGKIQLAAISRCCREGAAETVVQQRLGHRAGDPAVPASLRLPCGESGIMPGCILWMRDSVTAADF